MRKNVLENLKSANGNSSKDSCGLKVSIKIGAGKGARKKKNTVSIPESGKSKDVKEVNNYNRPKRKLNTVPYMMKIIRIKPKKEH